MDLDQLTDEQYLAFEEFKAGHNLFITGPGGVGKSFLINLFVMHCNQVGKNVQVCALTGCAAILLGLHAKTIHSWSGIHYCKGPKDDIIKRVNKSWPIKSRWKKTRVLIIDEVSMMSKKMLIILEELGRRIRNQPSPFGGIQVVFCGDFYQLPPVCKDRSDDSLFCFEAPVWKKLFALDKHIQLTKIFRQKDPRYLELLAEIREGTISGDNIQLLRERIEVTKPENITQLFPLRASVDHVNKTKYSELANQETTYALVPNYNMERYCRTGAQIDSDKLRKCRGLNEEQRGRELERLYKQANCMKKLTLKKGTYIMCIANIALEQGIANGTQGIVEDFVGVDNAPLIRFNNGTVKTLSRYCWQSEDYPTIGFKQYPVVLAWATTIHKMQGSSLEQAIMDLGSNVFEAGQIYVGLSRVKSLEGLYLTKFNPRVIKTNPKVREFYRQLPTLDIEVEEVEEEEVEEEVEEEAEPLTKTITMEQRDVLKVVKMEADSNKGQKWTNEEELLLLQELNNNINIKSIAQSHKRTIGGINSRRRKIAFDLFNQKIPMKEIILKTKLSEDQINKSISLRENKTKELQKTSTNNPSSKKQISSDITLELFLKGNTLEDICTTRNIKEETIINHIIKYIPHKSITYDKFMTENEYLLIKTQFDLLSLTCKLREIKDNLPEEISYNKMRIVRQLLSN